MAKRKSTTTTATKATGVDETKLAQEEQAPQDDQATENLSTNEEQAPESTETQGNDGQGEVGAEQTQVEASDEKEEAQEQPLTEALNKDTVSVPAHLQSLRNTLDRYLREMAPNAAYTPTIGVTQARLLHNLLDSLFRHTPEKFTEAWAEMVSVIKENRKGCFAEAMVFRGWHENALALRGSRRQRYEGLITLLLATADSGVGNASKMLDVAGICKRGLTEDESAKLLALYNVG